MKLLKTFGKFLFIIVWFTLAIILLYFALINDYSKITLIDITLLTMCFIYSLISVKIRKILGEIFWVISEIIELLM